MPSPFRKRQTPITQRMAEDTLVRNFSKRTIDSYTYHVDRFAMQFGNFPEDLGAEEMRDFPLLGQHEVHDLIQCVEHPKHRTVILTLYAAGLRLAESGDGNLRATHNLGRYGTFTHRDQRRYSDRCAHAWCADMRFDLIDFHGTDMQANHCLPQTVARHARFH